MGKLTCGTEAAVRARNPFSVSVGVAPNLTQVIVAVFLGGSELDAGVIPLLTTNVRCLSAQTSVRWLFGLLGTTRRPHQFLHLTMAVQYLDGWIPMAVCRHHKQRPSGAQKGASPYQIVPFAVPSPPFDYYFILSYPFSFLLLLSFHYTPLQCYPDAPPRVLHGARCHPHPWHLSPLPKTFCATRLLSRCFRRLRARSFAQDVVEKRGCAVCGGRASPSGAYHDVGADGGPSRVVSLTQLSRPRHEKRKRRFHPFSRAPTFNPFLG